MDKMLTCKEHVHIANYIILEDNEQTECQKRGILEYNVKHNAPNIDAATAVITAICRRSKYNKQF